MSLPILAAWVVTAVLALAPLVSTPFEQRFYRSKPDTPHKLFAFALNITLSWGLTSVVVWIYGWQSLLDGRLIPPAWSPALKIATPFLALVLVGYFLLGLLPLIQSMRGRRWRTAYAAAVRRAAASFEGLLPNNNVECIAFVAVSLTAGVCEELLYRGFLLRFLSQDARLLPLAAALATSCIIFGLNHAYQGLRGILTTAAAGLAFGTVYLLTGSLLPSIVLHVLVDAQIAYVFLPISPGRSRASAINAS